MLSLGGSNKSRDDEPDALGQLIGQLLLLGYRATCMSLDAFLHEGFGTTYVRAGPVAVPLGLWFLGQFPAADPRPMSLYLIAYAALWATAAGRVVVRWWRGQRRLHSLYTGRPFVLWLAPRWSEEVVKQAEPVAAGLAGWAARGWNRPLGDWLLLAAALSFARAAIQAAGRRGDAIELHDMAEEEQMVAEKFRDLQRPPRGR